MKSRDFQLGGDLFLVRAEKSIVLHGGDAADFFGDFLHSLNRVQNRYAGVFRRLGRTCNSTCRTLVCFLGCRGVNSVNPFHEAMPAKDMGTVLRFRRPSEDAPTDRARKCLNTLEESLIEEEGKTDGRHVGAVGRSSGDVEKAMMLCAVCSSRGGGEEGDHSAMSVLQPCR